MKSCIKSEIFRVKGAITFNTKPLLKRRNWIILHKTPGILLRKSILLVQTYCVQYTVFRTYKVKDNFEKKIASKLNFLHSKTNNCIISNILSKSKHPVQSFTCRRDDFFHIWNQHLKNSSVRSETIRNVKLDITIDHTV